ncbi:MAG: bifunctional diaminohydroxyphosphoribosylaminopyrimidine deaminase/5-amino-6-(5-phosphoribosylamino)uracil reductase RibD [Thermodesulfovibrionales bacterium]|nr:bifunctional diaminohydroxyphosphoribosylaminopyrimidine deaminase/5-amino-6-(5-phosphoribosylamino)uracil reductase RibD [Thermodesulfovibrionales bacterium]
MSSDIFYMKRALRLARKALGMTSPNPLVGAVVVRSGRIIAEGYHERPGLPHAEAVALERAGSKAKGATLYVNLEPCCHLDKRTPPCAQAIIKAGIKRVVIGMIDPNPKVSGRGVELLRKAGIEVKTGVLEEEARRLNEFYIKHITTGLPFVILKIAMTLDGKIATEKGESKWITSLSSRRYVHRLRSSVDAVLTAIGTVKADDPELTVRYVKGKNPVRVVIDPDFETPLNARVMNTPPATIIFTKRTDHPPLPQGVSIEYFESERLNLKDALKRLYQKGITSVLIEGGSSLNYYALKDEIVDKVLFFIAPKIIGGKDSLTPVGGISTGLENPWRLKDIKIRRLEEDILIEGYIEK